jgi:hypothetical protein
MQVVPSNTAICGCKGTSLPLSDILLLYLKHQLLWPCIQQHGTMIYHSQTAQPCCTTCLSSTLYIETLLTRMYFSVTAFHFYIFSYNFLWFTLFTQDNSLSVHHSFLCLGSQCHNTTSAMPNDLNPMPTPLYISCFRGSEYMAYEHVNDSFFTPCYTNVEIPS